MHSLAQKTIVAILCYTETVVYTEIRLKLYKFKLYFSFHILIIFDVSYVVWDKKKTEEN